MSLAPAAAAGELPSAPTAEQLVVPLVNSVGVIESMAGNDPVTYADDNDYYDAPEYREGKDWVRENHCVGCDCEFTSKQALDAHCCLEDGYAADDSSGQSNTDPTVEAVVPPESIPLATRLLVVSKLRVWAAVENLPACQLLASS